MSQEKIMQANMLRDSGKTKEAMKALKPFLNDKDYQVATNAHIALGICYANESKNEKAIEMYKKAIDLCEKNGWLPRIGGIARDLGIVYKNAKKFKEAEKILLKSIEFIKRYYDEGQGVHASLGIGYSKLGLTYSDAKQFAKAKKTFALAKKHLAKGTHEYWKLIGMIDNAYFLVETQNIASLREAKKILEVAVSEGIKQEKEYKLTEAFMLAGDVEKGLKNKEGAKMLYSIAKITVTKIFDSKEVRERFLEEIDKKLKGL